MPFWPLTLTWSPPMTKTSNTWDDYGEDYPFAEHRAPEIHMIRHGVTGTPICVFDDIEKVETWLADFDEEVENFDVVSVPGKYPRILLERNGMFLPTSEAALSHACYQLRDDEAFECRVFYLASDLDEKAMKMGLEEWKINHTWIRWWMRNDFPWIEDWENSPDPDSPRRLEEFDAEGKLIEFDANGDKIKYESDDSHIWRDNGPMSESELKDLAMAMRAGTVFSSDHIPPHGRNMLGSVFMPLLLGGRNIQRSIAIHNFTLFYENLSEAGPRSINGMPCFFSVRMLKEKDHKRLYAKMDQIEKALADV